MAVDPVPQVNTTSASPVSTIFSEISQNLTLNASITGSPTTVNEGIVTFTVKNGATVIGSPVSGLVANGVSSVTYSLPGGTAAGSYTIEASYGGGVSFLPSSDPTPETLTVGKATATITLVPTMTEWGMLILALLIGASAIYRLAGGDARPTENGDTYHYF